MTDEGVWITIVVRAWDDAGEVRIRLLRADSAGGRDHRVVTSIDQAAATLTSWLQVLETAGTTSRRRTGRRGADGAGDDDADGRRRRS
jgi:hypothetical protein